MDGCQEDKFALSLHKTAENKEQIHKTEPKGSYGRTMGWRFEANVMNDTTTVMMTMIVAVVGGFVLITSYKTGESEEQSTKKKRTRGKNRSLPGLTRFIFSFE
jgi:hypothetical protein